MAIKTINGIMKTDSTLSTDEFNDTIKKACVNAEELDMDNQYVGMIFNLKDKRIDFVPSTSVADEFNVSTTTIIDNSSESSVDDEYNRDVAIPITVGGAVSGTVFDGTVADALDKILYPFIKPYFSYFRIDSQATVLEVGDKISQGTKVFKWAVSHIENMKDDSLKIYLNTTLLEDNISKESPMNINITEDIVKMSATSVYFKVIGTDEEDNLVYKTNYIYWRWRVYYGSISTELITKKEVTDLQLSALKYNENNTYSLPENDYKWICYPVVFGEANKFVDVDTGFGVAMEQPITLNITNIFGASEDYYCYRTTNSMAGSINIKIG